MGGDRNPCSHTFTFLYHKKNTLEATDGELQKHSLVEAFALAFPSDDLEQKWQSTEIGGGLPQRVVGLATSGLPQKVPQGLATKSATRVGHKVVGYATGFAKMSATGS